MQPNPNLTDPSLLPPTDPTKPRWVPVVSSAGKPLMPCSPKRARKLVEKGAAIKRWRKGFFYIQLTQREDGDTQPIAIGIDPGSKREGYTVKSEAHTYLNVQGHAADGKAIQKKLEARRNARNARRQRHTPCRANRQNRGRKANWIPPSTKARWQLKLNVLLALSRLYPITAVVIEDVKARTIKGAVKWNASFSPVQNGKNWLYREIEHRGYELVKMEGHETYELRQALNLGKTKNKLAAVFSAHCVDSWVLANHVIGGHTAPDMVSLVELKQLSYHRRQLHVFQPVKGGERRRVGGTRSMGYQRGTLVTHPKHQLCLLGGHNGIDRVSLHTPTTYTRVSQHAKPTDLTKIAHTPWCVIDPHATFNRVEKRAQRQRLQQLA